MKQKQNECTVCASAVEVVVEEMEEGECTECGVVFFLLPEELVSSS